MVRTCWSISTPAGAGRSPRAYSLVEMLVVLGIAGVLMGFLLPVVSKARRAAKAATCVSNLHQIAVAFHVYAGDNWGRLPDPGAADETWETVMWPYLRMSDVFRCPSDEEVFPAFGSSYDWRDTGDPLTTLAGRPLSEATARNCVLVFDSLPHWHTKGKMNVAFTDASACAVDVGTGLEDLMQPVSKHKKPKKGKGPNRHG